jgi:hypothetical protein
VRLLLRGGRHREEAVVQGHHPQGAPDELHEARPVAPRPRVPLAAPQSRARHRHPDERAPHVSPACAAARRASARAAARHQELRGAGAAARQAAPRAQPDPAPQAAFLAPASAPPEVTPREVLPAVHLRGGGLHLALLSSLGVERVGGGAAYQRIGVT